MSRLFAIATILVGNLTMTYAEAAPRPREAGIQFGVMRTGPLNAITDVAGVTVGHKTIIEGDSIRTGVTAIVPHAGNIYQDKLPAGVAVGNGYGKFMGTTQVEELGEIETPILITNTLNVPEAASALVEWTLRQPGNQEVRSVNAVVGETNDGTLNDIRARRVTKEDALAALTAARSGVVEEGAVGGGTGMVAFGWKGGIGTSSRRLPSSLGGYTVGVLVQSNFGGVLSVAGVPVGQALGRYYLNKDLEADQSADGSIIIVIATDAPLSDRNLKRLAHRAFIGLGRTGSPMTNGSGDYSIAFSTAASVRRTSTRRSAASQIEELPNDRASPLFMAAAEATEEAIINSMFAAKSMKGHGGSSIEALPAEKVIELYRKSRGR